MTGGKVLVIGSGGREHALAWKLATSSDQVDKVFVAPGNGGTHKDGKISNVALNINDHASIVDWCKANKIDLVVVGPEDPLDKGLSDVLASAGIKCFGPSKKGAQIESSKAFAKEFMDRHRIPTAGWKAFTDPNEAKEYIMKADHPALVVKASGLAAGKGVIVANNKEEACEAVDSMLKDHTFGSAGEKIVVEELLTGNEVSALAFTDGTNVAMIPPSQDHKRLLEGDQGPNTGGMGAYCPCNLVSNETLEDIKKEIIQRTVDGLRKEGITYVGVLYAGLMLTEDGPKVLEFNCRFGDPETQAIMPILECDLYQTMLACVDGKLPKVKVTWKKDRVAVGVVLVSEGYPGSYKKGKEITGLKEATQELGVHIFHAGTTLVDGKIVTSGGRVLTVVAIDESVETAAQKAQRGAEVVSFEGAFHRKDIAYRALKGCEPTYVHKMSYKTSGVNIEAADTLVTRIKGLAQKTLRSGTCGSIGGFGGVFDLKNAGYTDPLLVSGTDGVGTKLKVAQACNMYDTIGIDLVAMCVNDILTQGAEPLFFLDYFACGRLNVDVAENVIYGITKGCEMANAALIGGETAEMPGMYKEGDFDLAGFAVGAVNRDRLLPRIDEIQPGDVVIGLPSSGIHSNGFSLVRKLMDIRRFKYNDPAPFNKKITLGKAFLVPTKIYVRNILPIVKAGYVKAMAHITGGGLVDNIPRVLPNHLRVELDASKWEIAPVLSWLFKEANIADDDMLQTFNCGLGMVLITSPERADAVVNAVTATGEKAHVVGKVMVAKKGEPRVVVHNFDRAMLAVGPVVKRKKVGVLISGSGTNLQALIDHTIDPSAQSQAEIVTVISNVPGVEGLKRAERVGIPTTVIRHKDFKSREEFDQEVSRVLRKHEVEIVCLAGFMRMLSEQFVTEWKGRLINIHPSLLPSFPGMHAHRQALAAGVKITGCTVHFVEPEMDSGAIILQEAVPIEIGDTEETLQDRVKVAEHRIYPRALELLARGMVVLENGKAVWQPRK